MADNDIRKIEGKIRDNDGLEASAAHDAKGAEQVARPLDEALQGDGGKVREASDSAAGDTGCEEAHKDVCESADPAMAQGNDADVSEAGAEPVVEADAAADDADLEEALKGAYEAMNPTPEQESRMLAAILAAAEGGSETAGRGDESAKSDESAETEAASDGGPNVRTPETPETPETPKTPKANQSRRVKPWIIALPLAACLAVGAVLVGVNASSVPTASEQLQPVSSQSGQDAKNATSVETAATADDADVEMEYIADGDEAGALGVAEEAGVMTPNAIMPQGGSARDEMYMPRGPEDDVDFNTEEYDSVDERGFVSTKSSPLSTVSADVDTASYCNLRRMINDGAQLSDIPTGAVRIEEMLNYFHYDYAAPTGDDLFSMQAQASACPWNKDTQLLVMGFATQQEAKAADKGSNLVFLVDVSGSMNSPDKLELLQDSFAKLTEHLDGNDRVSIVTYANGEEIVLEGAHGDDEREIMRAIYKLRADGATNGQAGLAQAYEVAKRNYIEGGVNRIIMASDGDLNVGMTSESDLHDYVDKQRESGIYLSVLGFGSGNYKDNKMETLADHGNGSYHYIDCIEEAERVLSENLMANLVPFADDVKVQVEFNPAQVKAYRLIGYDNRVLADEDFRNDEVDAGDVGPNAQFTVAYEIVLADSAFQVDEPELKYGSSNAEYRNNSEDWLTCSMRYHVFDGDTMREQQLEVTPSAATATPSDDWKFAASVIEFGMLARDSKYAGTSSIDGILDLTSNAASDAQRDEFRKLVVKAG